ncbi:MAG: cytosine permease [Lachnospiraceae bacterium]|jgi:cytosine permease|nr:cytosine permease [Lachnospiraceae bacterium]MCH4032312.1 cytosine permease [Lachnospiraceae bacterium]MCH4108810.1 cytosine permease [Lachnospiraceae bacterium]MCI1302341.1 cytosine permease [Lachnospiraceae bacterium]MCI1331506.1 cytosine permease [Lachnospiraceae bacterium]
MNKESTVSKSERETTDSDYPLTHVPKDARRTFFSVMAVLLGITFFSPTMAVGAQIGTAFTFGNVLLITLLGDLILGIYVAVNCGIGAKTGLTSVMLCRYTFGRAGAKWADLLLGGTQIGWYAYVSAYVGMLFATAFNLPGSATWFTLAWALIFGVTALYGYKAMEKIAYVAVPALLILVILIPVLGIRAAGGLSALVSAVPTTSMSVATAMTAIVGTFSSMGTQACNWSRFSKSTKSGFWSGFVAFMIGNTVMLGAGIVGALAFGESDFIVILMNLGLSAVALVVLTLNIWTTAHAGAYAWAVAGAEAANKENKTPFLLIGLAIAVVLACTGIYNQLIPFLNILGVFIPPIGGAIIGDYFFTFKRRLPKVECVTFKMLRISPVIAYAAGTIAAWVTNVFNVGVPPLLGIAVSIVCVPIANAILKAVGVGDMHGISDDAEYV